MNKHLFLILSFLIPHTIFAMKQSEPMQHISWKDLNTLPPDIRNLIMRYYLSDPSNRCFVDDLFLFAIAANQKEFQGHSDCINSVKFNGSSKELASGSQDGSARIWDISGKLLQTLQPGQLPRETLFNGVQYASHAPITSVRFGKSENNGAQTICISAKENYFAIWNSQNNSYEKCLDWQYGSIYYSQSPLQSFSKNGFLAKKYNAHKLHLCRLSKGVYNTYDTIKVDNKVISLALNHDASLLAINAAKKILIFDVKNKKILRTFSCDQTGDDRLLLAFNAQNILFSCSTSDLQIYDCNNNELDHYSLPYPQNYSQTTPQPSAHCLALSPSEEYLAIGFSDGCITLCNIEKLLALKKYFKEHAPFDELVTLCRLMLHKEPSFPDPNKNTLSLKSMVDTVRNKKSILVEHNNKKIDVFRELITTIAYLMRISGIINYHPKNI